MGRCLGGGSGGVVVHAPFERWMLPSLWSEKERSSLVVRWDGQDGTRKEKDGENYADADVFTGGMEGTKLSRRRFRTTRVHVTEVCLRYARMSYTCTLYQGMHIPSIHTHMRSIKYTYIPLMYPYALNRLPRHYMLYSPPIHPPSALEANNRKTLISRLHSSSTCPCSPQSSFSFINLSPKSHKPPSPPLSLLSSPLLFLLPSSRAHLLRAPAINNALALACGTVILLKSWVATYSVRVYTSCAVHEALV